MTASELVERILEHPEEAAGVLPMNTGIPGISEAYFSRLQRLFAEDHSRLGSLRPTTNLIIKYGDDRAFGYRALAVVDRVSGRWKSSARSFIRAGENGKTPKDRLSFKIGAVDSLARSGRVDEAVSLGRSIVFGLEAIHEDGLVARARLNVAYALMEQDKYQQALHELVGLPQILLRHGFTSDAASGHLALSTCLLFGGSSEKSKREGLRAVEDAEHHGLTTLANIARGNIAYADLLCGNADLALAELLKLKLLHFGEPVEHVRTLEYLGDAYLSMNLFGEAADTYAEAMAEKVCHSALHRAHLKFGIGRALASSGRHAEAVLHLKSASRVYKRLGNMPWFVGAETAISVSEFALGKTGAIRRLHRTVMLAKQVADPYHLCETLLLASEHDGPVTDLELAATQARRFHLHRFTWRIYAERARRSEPRSRLVYYRKMFGAILRDQAGASSLMSRLRFLHDKQDAIRNYIDELLLNPTPSRIREAINVVSKSRSATLLDEILLGNRPKLSGRILSRLAELRSEMNQQLSPGGRDGIRRSSPRSSDLVHTERLWKEEVHSALELANIENRPEFPANDSLLFLTDPSRCRVLSKSGVIEIQAGTAEIEQRLQWLNYELLAPMADRNASSQSAIKELKEVGELLLRPLLHISGTLGLCPESMLWRVPWIACLDAMGEERELELRLHPTLRGENPRLEKRRPMLWIAEHPDLPHAKREGEEFLEAYPDALVCRSAAEVRDLFTKTDVSILHVVSHSKYRIDHPMFSSIDFVDGPLLASEIARSGLRAELVTLSGCDTARLSDVNRLEPDGLVRAFLACGAGYVVGSAWPLDDRAAARFFNTFFQSLNSTANIGISLGSARKNVREWMDHPYYWAFPLLYAGYRS